jgi:hypothetical protein
LRVSFQEGESYTDSTTNDLKAQVKTKPALMEFAAIQIESIGVYERLSNGKTKEGTA